VGDASHVPLDWIRYYSSLALTVSPSLLVRYNTDLWPFGGDPMSWSTWNHNTRFNPGRLYQSSATVLGHSDVILYFSIGARMSGSVVSTGNEADHVTSDAFNPSKAMTLSTTTDRARRDVTRHPPSVPVWRHRRNNYYKLKLIMNCKGNEDSDNTSNVLRNMVITFASLLIYITQFAKYAHYSRVLVCQYYFHS